MYQTPIPISLPVSLIEPLRTAAISCGASRLVLFGSRARGDHRDTSDIDLAVWGLGPTEAGRLRLLLDDLPTLLCFDLVPVTPDTNPALLKNIQNEGVVLYAADEV